MSVTSKDPKQYFVHKDSALYLKTGYIGQIELPRDYFTKGTDTTSIAEFVGKNVNTFGLVTVDIWKESPSEDYNLNNKVATADFKIPTILQFNPYKVEEDTKRDKTILYFNSTEALIDSTTTMKGPAVPLKYMTMVLNGKIPDNIGYLEAIEHWIKCYEINGAKFGVTASFFDLLVMCCARDPKNPTRQFRQYLKENKNAKEIERIFVNLDKVPSMTSHFGALTNSDPKYGITASIGATRTGSMEPTGSSLEKAIE